jgi:hypothetical protein
MLELINLILIVIIVIVLVISIIKNKLSCISTGTTTVTTDKSDAIKTSISSIIQSDDVKTTTPITTTTTTTPVSTACVGITSSGATCIGNLASGTTSSLPKPKVSAFVLTNDSVVTTPDHLKLVTDLKASNQNGVVYILDSSGNITTNFQIVESAISTLDLITFLTQNPILKTNTTKSSELIA